MNATARHPLSLAVLLAALAAVGPFSIDAYLPAFPEISAALSADSLQIQQTLSIYLVTFGLMTLWHGAFSDSFGRRRVVLVGIVVYALSALGCAFSTSIEMLWTMRALQGLAAGTGMVVGRAIVRDLYEGAEAQRLIAQIAIMFAVAPAIAPMFGGWILHLVGWRAIFFFLALASALLLLVCWRQLPESLPPEKRRPFAILPLLASYRSILSNPAFLVLSIGLGLFFGGFFIYVMSATAFIRQLLGLGATDFHWLFIPAMIGMMSGSWISGRVSGRWSDYRTLCVASAVMGAAACLNLLVSGFLPSWRIPAVLPIIGYNLGIAMAVPTVTLRGLDMFPQNRGTAASCQAFVQTIINSAIAAFAAPMLWGSRLNLSLGMAAFGGIGALLVLWQVRRAGEQRTEDRGQRTED
ncbi:MAG: multidrug effflux MFS transporter [Zoogloeaceae bacterium]|jgi:DHA1 family bicyclomycin/chloramphenicol resistance-like MFS transporter|nr:multidrug effflux MFS transporter [Zoogloeaceae bacterium]